MLGHGLFGKVIPHITSLATLSTHLQFLLRPVGSQRIFGLGGGGGDLADDPSTLGSTTRHESSQELTELTCNNTTQTSQEICLQGKPIKSSYRKHMTNTCQGMDNTCREAAGPPRLCCPKIQQESPAYEPKPKFRLLGEKM